MLYLDYGQPLTAMGKNFEIVESFEVAHAIVATKTDVAYAFVLERDTHPSGSMMELSEFKEVYDPEGGWRTPNYGAIHYRELWEREK